MPCHRPAAAARATCRIDRTGTLALAVASWTCLLAAGGAGAGAGEPAATVVPRVDAAPALDGDLGDACWQRALVIGGFSLPKSKEPAAKGVTARLCFDDSALYVAVTCQEPEPARLRTRQPDGEQVWQDDCVEVWIRTTADQGEFDQFIVNPAGSRESLRRSAGGEPWRHEWRAAAKIGASEWRAEIAIPFKTLGIETPRPGFMAQMKIGREDHTSADVGLATWPPGSPYAGADGYAPVFFGTDNLLRNPDFSERRGDGPARWGASEGDAARFTHAVVDGRAVARFDCPGRYSCVNQDLALEPDTLYRMEADVRGPAGVYMRVRTKKRPGDRSGPATLWIKPSAGFARRELRFTTGPGGDALVIVGTDEGRGTGVVELAALRLAREVASPAWGDAIPVRAGAAQPLVVTKLLVTDCRAVRGFVGAPVDGSVASGSWDAKVWEYNQPGAGAGVGYHYLRNDGLHITLADDRGFDAVVIRGGVRARMWSDCPSYERPEGGTLVVEFPGRAETTRLLAKERVRTKRVSFFDVADGRIANVSFFRLGDARGAVGRPAAGFLVGPAPAEGLPEIEERFGPGERAAWTLVPAARSAGVIDAAAGKAFHLVSAPFGGETVLSAVGLDLNAADCGAPAAFMASVQDPLDPQSELLGADFELSGPGQARLILDFPDQVVPAGKRLWLSLRFERAAKVRGVSVELYGTPREQALPEALAYRKLLVKSYFAAISEPRPWNMWYTDEDVERTLAGRYGPQCRELREAILHCVDLAPDDPEVRAYYEWVWRQLRTWRKERKRGVWLDASHARIDPSPVEGAPEWAVVARQAWLEARRVPEWWLDNRLVPTGEFGGVVGDDSDMYQNYADFPMLETGGVAARLKAAAAALAELAEETTLTAGINRHTTDPLHAYEEGPNHEALMAWWFYGDPVYMERCMVAARSTADGLTVVTPKGHRHFKSQACGAADLKMDRKTDVDGHSHPLMWHPALEVAWYNANPNALKWLREWADGWLDHMKPREYAIAVDVASETVTEISPEALGGSWGAQGSVFEFVWWVTGDARYIAPFLVELAAEDPMIAPTGILPEMHHRGALGDLARRIPERFGGGTAEALVTGEKRPLVDALRRDIAEMQNYGRMYTSAEPFTDRVFLYPITNAALAYTGGYATRNKLCHSHAASYEGFGTDYAALVLVARADRFKALMFNFAPRRLSGRVRLWTLDHGVYALRQGPDTDRDDRFDRVTRRRRLEVARGSSIEVTLPPGEVTILELGRARPLGNIRLRADLALSPLELEVEGGAVRAVAHNIGSARVERVTAALVDAEGTARARKALGALEAPVDLVPKRIEFRLEGLPAGAEGWSLVLDPEDEVAEICEGNNRVAVPAPARASEEN